MSRLEFKPEDFYIYVGGINNGADPLTMPERVAKVAQAKFDQWLIEQPSVFIKNIESGIWDMHSGRSNENTHTARLVCIEELPKECQHKNTIIWEPHLAGARKCVDCEMIYNPNRVPNWLKECAHELDGDKLIYYNQPTCKHCGSKLKAKWEPA